MPGQTGGAEYDARIARAERLSSPHSAATEFLEFYGRVASFQKLLRANIAAAHRTARRYRLHCGSSSLSRLSIGHRKSRTARARGIRAAVRVASVGVVDR